MTRLLSPALLVLALFVSFPAPAAAQFPFPIPDLVMPRPVRRPTGSIPTARSLDDVPHHVLSTNPGALLFATPSVEYEFRALPFMTVGGGASTSWWTIGHLSKHRELLARVYPAGMAFNGASLGVRLGASHVSDLGEFRTWAFEGGYTATPSRHAYFSITAGVRHIGSRADSLFGEFQPIIRTNFGIGF